MNATSAAIFDLDDRERFIYEYGRFILEWNALEFYIEALVWYIRSKRLHQGVSCTQNFREINKLSPSKKRGTLMDYLKRIRERDVLTALNEVFDVAERNNWIHALVFPIKEKEGGEYEDDTWLWYRLDNAGDRPKLLQLTESYGGGSPFVEFYEAWNKFRSAAERSFGFLVDVADYYLDALTEEENLGRQSLSN